MLDPRGPAPHRFRQIRLTVAEWLDRMSLRVRLGLLVALTVTSVVGLATYLEIRGFESRILADLAGTARGTAQAAADDFEIRPGPLTPDDASSGLREFIEAVPSVRVISIVRVEDGQPALFASTASAERPAALDVARQAIAARGLVTGPEDGAFRRVAVPAFRTDELFGAVVVTYSTTSVEQLHQSARRVVLWFVPAAVVLLTVVVDLLTRRLIHAPIAGMRETMRRVEGGDLAARAPVVRRDEIGAVAAGLNAMLSEMENFNAALQARVAEGTAELRARNVELVESYQRLFGLREALARAEQMAAVGQAAASVAHQIGTPLNLISGYVQMLREEAGPDARASRRLAIVQEQIAKVTGIVRTMLDHARRPVPRGTVSLPQVVEGVCDVARPTLAARAVTLALDIDRTVPPVRGDAVQLELALLNLVSNAIDAMPEGGALRITVGPGPSGTRIEVADTGTGIPADLLPRIFDPWVTTKGLGRGSGLGLSITRGVVTAHGGTIVVASEPGAGTRFTIELPSRPDEPPPGPLPA